MIDVAEFILTVGQWFFGLVALFFGFGMAFAIAEGQWFPAMALGFCGLMSIFGGIVITLFNKVLISNARQNL